LRLPAQPNNFLHSYYKMIFLFLNWEIGMQRKDNDNHNRSQLRKAPQRSEPTPADARSQRGESAGEDNPLLWMFRRKDKSGENMIGPAAFAAGERLRADLTFAGMLPRVTMNWTGQPGSDRSDQAARLNPTEAALAARQRVDLAMRAVGPEFSGVLFDLCGFGKGLELIERDRNWPARSAKIVVKLALASLARHYGFDDLAKGRGMGRMQAWSVPDARPRTVAARTAAELRN
jgi:Domain of unknown function (DUF6456)